MLIHRFRDWWSINRARNRLHDEICSLDSRRIHIALVHFQGVDRPICLRECGWIILHKSLATTGKGGASAVLTPHTTGPITAEGSVEDEVIVHEMLIDVAIAAADEAGCCSSPCGWSGVGAQGVTGNAPTRPEPDVDVASCPLHCVDPASSVIEVGAIVVCTGGFDWTAKTTFAAAACEGTSAACVHSHLVLATGVDALDDIDLATAWPVRTRHPEGGPCAADTAGHMGEIEDHQGMSVLGFACEANTVAPSARGDICMIDAKCNLSSIDAEEALGGGSALVDIVDVSMGWVIELVLGLASGKYNCGEGLLC